MDWHKHSGTWLRLTRIGVNRVQTTGTDAMPVTSQRQHLGGGDWLAAGVGREHSGRVWLASVFGQQRKQWSKLAAADAAGDSDTPQ